MFQPLVKQQLDLAQEFKDVGLDIAALRDILPLHGGAKTRLLRKSQLTLIMLSGFEEGFGSQANGCAYRIQDVFGDGACFFHAVALHVSQSHLELRALVVAHINETFVYYSDFIVDGNIDAYLGLLEQPTTWADHLAILAMSEVLERDILVYRLREHPIRIGERNSRLPILLVHNNDHFLAIVRDQLPGPVDQVTTHVAPLTVGRPQYTHDGAVPAVVPSPRPGRRRALGFQHNLRICSQNVSSLRKHWQTLVLWDYDVYLLQEVFADDRAQRLVAKDLLEAGYTVIWGAPTKAQGGVAIVARSKYCLKAMSGQWSATIRALYDQGRFLHCVIACG